MLTERVLSVGLVQAGEERAAAAEQALQAARAELEQARGELNQAQVQAAQREEAWAAERQALLAERAAAQPRPAAQVKGSAAVCMYAMHAVHARDARRLHGALRWSMGTAGTGGGVSSLWQCLHRHACMHACLQGIL
jgi:hypothetical protein